MPALQVIRLAGMVKVIVLPVTPMKQLLFATDDPRLAHKGILRTCNEVQFLKHCKPQAVKAGSDKLTNEVQPKNTVYPIEVNDVKVNVVAAEQLLKVLFWPTLFNNGKINVVAEVQFAKQESPPIVVSDGKSKTTIDEH